MDNRPESLLTALNYLSEFRLSPSSRQHITSDSIDLVCTKVQTWIESESIESKSIISAWDEVKLFLSKNVDLLTYNFKRPPWDEKSRSKLETVEPEFRRQKLLALERLAELVSTLIEQIENEFPFVDSIEDILDTLELRRDSFAKVIESETLSEGDRQFIGRIKTRARSFGIFIHVCFAHIDTIELYESFVDEVRSRGEGLTAYRSKKTGSKEVFPPLPEVSVEKMEISYDGKTYECKSIKALLWLKILVENPEIIPSDDLEKYDSKLGKVRADKLKKYLPKAILKIIESTTGKGSRLRQK